MTSRNVGVLGPGAVAGLLAARLSKAGHEVTVRAAERTAVAIELNGLKLVTPHDQLETTPIARPWLTAPVEVLFVTTRATDFPAALDRIPPALLETSTIVPLLNGLDHVPVLRARYPRSRVVAASVNVEASRPRVGLTKQHSAGCEFTVTGDRAPLEREWSVGSLLRGPGLEARIDPTRRGSCGRNSRPSRRTRCSRPAPTSARACARALPELAGGARRRGSRGRGP